MYINDISLDLPAVSLASRCSDRSLKEEAQDQARIRAPRSSDFIARAEHAFFLVLLVGLLIMATTFACQFLIG
jgi:hypothetical protein